MADIIDFQTRVEFPKEAQAPILSPEVVQHLLDAAMKQLSAPLAGAMILLWDANGIAATSDNRSGMFTQEQLMWLAYGLAHLKGRGVINPTATTGNVPPMPEGA